MAFDGKWLPDATLAQRAPDCEHTMLPASMGIPIKKTRDEFAEYFKPVTPLILEAKVAL